MPNSVYLYLLILILLLWLDYKRGKRHIYNQIPLGKGNKEEVKIKKLLTLFSFIFRYYTITDVLFRNLSNKSTQIDHILLTRKNIYIIESKNIKGYISGYREEQTWINKYDKTNYNIMYNPIRQNYGHIKFFQKHIVDIDLESIVYFNPKVNIDAKTISENKEIKVGIFSLLLHIYMTEKNSKIVSSQEDIKYVFDKIQKKNLSNDTLEIKKHIDYVKEIRRL